ncbi:MAG TPA: hypothetical protein VFL59_01660 [Candidatus Nanopelagicales bacterium]|nr:hypothetical protein [Candidatus Nanopelagicales bacterium]
MVVRASSPEGVVEAVASLVSPGRVRVLLDGADAADPGGLGDRLAAALAPRPAVHVRASSYWRPAGQRFEWGKQDEDAFLHDWLDDGALRREVLDGFPSTGRVLPALRDPVTDRSVRAAVVTLPDDGVVVVSGAVLLGRGLPVDVAVHLRLSPAALVRRTPEVEAWTLPALARYVAEHDPESLADLVVRVDDPRHPALVTRA